jgi:thiosulfate dehydrogenase [quinone] large subunit
MRFALPSLPPSLALMPLRLFLGATFVYAGIHKLADPGFLQEGAPTYVGSQLEAFADGTPGGVVLRTLALPIPEIAGVGIALAEIAIGFLVVVGLLSRTAAVAGFALSVLLFLTATWKTRPYFLGSDIVFTFAWLPLVLAGTAGQPALDQLGRRGLTLVRGRRRRPPTLRLSGDLTRRALLGQAAALVGLATAGIAAGAVVARGAGPRLPSSAQPAAGVRIGSADDLLPGGAVRYRDPADGSPNVALRGADGTLMAFSALCTHAGCEVVHRAGALRCPCHGAVFDAATGAVQSGPAPTPLPRRRVVERAGQIYAL